VVSHPRVNRLQTAILGRHKLEARLRPVAERSTNGETRGTVVDIGGGTARSRAMWPASWTYYSIDPDDRVLAVDEQEAPIERIVGDAARLPLHDAVADVVLMQCVSHHLDAETWQRSLVEAERILKPDGSFIFLDGVWSKRRWVSRWFWRLDAGRFPRESVVIEDALRARFSIVETERFALVHDSILVTARHA
jgi:SAM-dependent methyltransferase